MAAPKNEEKRARIVKAATGLFSKYGFKRTSVDLLAAEAGVAKPTLYVYFADKEAIFRAVVETTCDELLEAATASSRGGGPLQERLARMLSAKFTSYWELVHASPHARELMDSQNLLAATIVQRFDKAFLSLLVTVLEGDDGVATRDRGLSATNVAHILLRAASGADYDATSASGHRKHLTELVELVVAGLAAPGGAKKKGR